MDDNLRFVCNNYHSGEPIAFFNQSGVIVLNIENLPLPSGDYYYHLQALVDKNVSDEIEFAGKFYVEAGDYFNTGRIPALKGGVFIEHSWKV